MDLIYTGQVEQLITFLWSFLFICHLSMRNLQSAINSSENIYCQVTTTVIISYFPLIEFLG